MTTRRVLGGAVRELRLARSRSLRSVAREIDVSPGHLSAIETGAKQLGLLYQRRLAVALGVSLDAISYVDPSGPENTGAPLEVSA